MVGVDQDSCLIVLDKSNGYGHVGDPTAVSWIRMTNKKDDDSTPDSTLTVTCTSADATCFSMDTQEPVRGGGCLCSYYKGGEQIEDVNLCKSRCCTQGVCESDNTYCMRWWIIAGSAILFTAILVPIMVTSIRSQQERKRMRQIARQLIANRRMKRDKRNDEGNGARIWGTANKVSPEFIEDVHTLVQQEWEQPATTNDHDAQFPSDRAGMVVESPLQSEEVERRRKIVTVTFQFGDTVNITNIQELRDVRFGMATTGRRGGELAIITKKLGGGDSLSFVYDEKFFPTDGPNSGWKPLVIQYYRNRSSSVVPKESSTEQGITERGTVEANDSAVGSIPATPAVIQPPPPKTMPFGGRLPAPTRPQRAGMTNEMKPRDPSMQLANFEKPVEPASTARSKEAGSVRGYRIIPPPSPRIRPGITSSFSDSNSGSGKTPPARLFAPTGLNARSNRETLEADQIVPGVSSPVINVESETVLPIPGEAAKLVAEELGAMVAKNEASAELTRDETANSRRKSIQATIDEADTINQELAAQHLDTLGEEAVAAGDYSADVLKRIDLNRTSTTEVTSDGAEGSKNPFPPPPDHFNFRGSDTDEDE